MKKLILAALAAFFVSGCGGLQSTDSETQFAVQYVVMKATGEFVEGDALRADRVRQIAAEVRQYAENENLLTIDAALAFIDSRINWERLDAADTAMVNLLLEKLRRRLVERFGEDAVAEDIRVTVVTLTEWVILASRP